MAYSIHPVTVFNLDRYPSVLQLVAVLIASEPQLGAVLIASELWLVAVLIAVNGIE